MIIKPYGDTYNDGKIQMSFTLPVPKSARGVAAAKEMAKSMGLIDPSVVHVEALDNNFSFYIVYGSVKNSIDYDKIKVEEITSTALTREEIENLISSNFDRDIVFVGASTGTDAHTVGIDAIMNMKGFAGHYGLERYHGIEAYNLGSQVLNEDFVKIAKEKKADVLLVSQTVTQKDVHLKNMIDLVELLESEGMRDDVVLIAGGARVTHSLAKELGYDAGFGPGSFAEDVATFAITALINKKKRS
ncbi:MAG: OAM dimerization domain-containing protein [Candidatus Izemoplasmatales bacterium]|nr:OAM dimerization domain-containing protein [Candidatus Izemoplasmatales bacterium]MDY0139396.1 OAM dimerization domain-containing protein [Candidatus Izemoplasmatales bacterium]